LRAQIESHTRDTHIPPSPQTLGQGEDHTTHPPPTLSRGVPQSRVYIFRSQLALVAIAINWGIPVSNRIVGLFSRRSSIMSGISS